MRKDKNYTVKQKIILGGNMLLSKRPEMTLPGGSWPNYFSKAHKHFVWDLEKKIHRYDDVC